MRVAWVTEYPLAGFSSRDKLEDVSDSTSIPWVTLQAPAVVAAGVELHVVTISKQATADDEFVENGIHFHVLKIPNVPRAMLAYQLDRRRIVRCLDRIRPALVHGFGTEASFGYAAASSAYPCVVMIQGIVARLAATGSKVELLRRPGLAVSLLFERLTVQHCRHFVCETMFAAAFVRGYRPNAVIHSINTPIGDEWFGVTPRQAVGDAAPEVLFVGRASAAKGIDVLLAAWPRVVEEFPNAVLNVVGACDSGYFRGAIAPAMARLGIEASVRFHGHQPAAFVRDRLASASLLALPTLMDTAPNVLAEARAAGVPVVAAAVGGIPELVEDGVDGLLVPAGSVDALGDAIRRLLRDPEAARRFAERGRVRAEEHRLATQIPKLIDVYNRIIGEAPNRT